MPDVSLVPVDHDPEFDHSLVPVDYDPFASEKFVNPAVQGMIGGLATLPQRAIENSAYSLQSGNYDPGPTLEAATLPMGTGAIAGVPVRGGEAVLGAGPIRAYHGSPHDFDAFSMDKIGTGEGAQAYGHGLYFADNEGVAKSYRDALSDKNFAGDYAQKYLTKNDGDAAKATQEMMDHAAAYEKNGEAGTAKLMRDGADLVRSGWTKPTGHMYEVNINADPAHFLDWDKPLSEQHPVVQDALKQFAIPHKVTADDLFAELKARGWDDKMARDYAEQQAYENKGAHAYRELETKARSGQASDYMKNGDIGRVSATEQLRGAGIPGIKYLDAGSRTPKALLNGQPIPAEHAAAQQAAEWLELYGSPDAAIKAQAGAVQHPYTQQMNQDALDLLKSGAVKHHQQGSSNYVVFNDKLIDIVKKYAAAGIALPPAIAAQYKQNFQPVDHDPFEGE